MLVRLLLYFIFIMKIVTNIINNNEEQQQQQQYFNPNIPFFVMQPHTIINQTLHSYCKEQYEFNIQPMYINLTQWPSGFIYARNPYQKIDNDDDTTSLSIQECTMELRASIGDRIRFVFYPIVNIRDEYDEDYLMPLSKTPCLNIRDNHETITIDCPIIFNTNKSTFFNNHINDYLSNSNIIYLELIQPFQLSNDYYDESYYQFKLFFTAFTPKLYIGLKNDLFVCPSEDQIDCDDSYCVHSNARCNGIYECRSKIDETSCINDDRSNGRTIYYISYFMINIKYIFIFIIISMF